MDDDVDHETAAAVAILALAGLVIALLLFWVTSAAASALCLTKKEARELWPRQHLYWYSTAHCWSNRRGGPPSGIKIERLNMIMAQDTKKEPRKGAVIKIVRASEYNEIDAQLDMDPFFEAKPIPFWAHMLDIDLTRYRTWYDSNGNVALLRVR